jgi:hypothetical protein
VNQISIIREEPEQILESQFEREKSINESQSDLFQYQEDRSRAFSVANASDLQAKKGPPLTKH